MSARQVPRNIDRANRNAEFVMTFLGVYYGLMFLFREPLFSFVMGCLSVYFINRITMDRPEGQAYRLIYKYVRIGHLIPAPRFVKRFEI